MRIDLYTKTVLTVIAFCLVYLCCTKPPKKVQADSITPVNIVGVNGHPLNTDSNYGVLPVGLQGTTLSCTGGAGFYSCSWQYAPIAVQVTK